MTSSNVQVLALVLWVFTSLPCFVHLWLRRRGALWRKLLWTPVIWIPLLGPLFYTAIYRIPSKKPDSEIMEAGHQM